MIKEELEEENEDLKKEIESLKEKIKFWELRYNSVKIELELRYRELSQITKQPFDLSQITKQGE